MADMQRLYKRHQNQGSRKFSFVECMLGYAKWRSFSEVQKNYKVSKIDG